MFDGPSNNPSNSLATLTVSELSTVSIEAISSPTENAGFVDSNEAYQTLKNRAMEKMLKSAPKHMRAMIQAGAC